MRALALRDQNHPALQRLADYLRTPALIEAFIRDAWRVVPDPLDVELISSPVRQVALYCETGFLSGDCDDAATLAACVLAATGWPCVLVAIRLHDRPEFSHVFARTFINNESFDIDPIVPESALPITNYAESMEVPV